MMRDTIPLGHYITGFPGFALHLTKTTRRHTQTLDFSNVGEKQNSPLITQAFLRA